MPRTFRFHTPSPPVPRFTPLLFPSSHSIHLRSHSPLSPSHHVAPTHHPGGVSPSHHHTIRFSHHLLLSPTSSTIHPVALHHSFHLTLVVLTPSSQWHYYYHYYHLHDHSVCQLSVRTSSDSVDRVVYSFPFIFLFTSFSLSLLLSLHSSYTPPLLSFRTLPSPLLILYT